MCFLMSPQHTYEMKFAMTWRLIWDLHEYCIFTAECFNLLMSSEWNQMSWVTADWSTIFYEIFSWSPWGRQRLNVKWFQRAMHFQRNFQVLPKGNSTPGGPYLDKQLFLCLRGKQSKRIFLLHSSCSCGQFCAWVFLFFFFFQSGKVTRLG